LDHFVENFVRLQTKNTSSSGNDVIQHFTVVVYRLSSIGLSFTETSYLLFNRKRTKKKRKKTNGSVDERSLVEGQDGANDHPVTAVGQDAHERKVKLMDVALKKSKKTLEIVSCGLLSMSVAVVKLVFVQAELEEHILQAKLSSSSQTANGQGLNFSFLFGKLQFKNDFLDDGKSFLDEIVEKLSNLAIFVSLVLRCMDGLQRREWGLSSVDEKNEEEEIVEMKNVKKNLF